MPRTQMERLWLFGGLIVALLLLLIGYTMFISPQNTKTSSERSLVSTANAANARLSSRIEALRNQSSDLQKYEADLQTAQLALPSTSGLPDFLRTLQSIGNATLTTVSSLTVGAPTDVTSVTTAGPASGSSSSGSSSNSSSSSATNTAPSGPRIYALPITASVTGSSNALDQFLTQLQTVQPRAVLISQLTEATTAVSPGGAGAASSAGGTSLQLTMQAFVAPSSAAERASLSQAAGK